MSCPIIIMVLALTMLLSLGYAQDPGAVTDVTVDVWPEPGAPARRYTLQCHPPGGTVSDPGAACARIAARSAAQLAPLAPEQPGAPQAPLAPSVPEPAPPPLPPRRNGNVLCTQIYGGPAVAMIRGLVGGLRVGGEPIGRRDGCEISTYDQTMELLGIPK